MTEASRLPNASQPRQQARIRACTGITTSGLLPLMVAIISVEELRALSGDEAAFTVIDLQPQVESVFQDDGTEQI